MPLALNDDELAALMDCARPLAPRDRAEFLREAAAELERYELLGVGLVARVCAKIQRRYLATRTGHNVGSKWG
jgi:hypothetical protein